MDVNFFRNQELQDWFIQDFGSGIGDQPKEALQGETDRQNVCPGYTT